MVAIPLTCNHSIPRLVFKILFTAIATSSHRRIVVFLLSDTPAPHRREDLSKNMILVVLVVDLVAIVVAYESAYVYRCARVCSRCNVSCCNRGSVRECICSYLEGFHIFPLSLKCSQKNSAHLVQQSASSKAFLWTIVRRVLSDQYELPGITTEAMSLCQS